MKIEEKKLGREGAFGIADTDADGKDRVLIDPRQPARERLDTIIHEALHHLCPQWSEGKVASTSRRISAMLWRDRWRRVER